MTKPDEGRLWGCGVHVCVPSTGTSVSRGFRPTLSVAQPAPNRPPCSPLPGLPLTPPLPPSTRPPPSNLLWRRDRSPQQGSTVRSQASESAAGTQVHCPQAGRPWRWKRHPLQHSCLGHPVDRGARRAAVHGVAQSRPRLRNQTTTLGNVLHLAAPSSPSVKWHSTHRAAAETRPREGPPGSPRGGVQSAHGKEQRLFWANVHQPRLEGEKRWAHGARHRQAAHARVVHTSPRQVQGTNDGESQPWGRQQATRQREAGFTLDGWIQAAEINSKGTLILSLSTCGA